MSSVTDNREYLVTLNISAEQYLKNYSGHARSIVTLDSRGRNVQFPATAMRRFVTHDGIQGDFLIRVDEDLKLVDIQRKTV